MVLMIVDIFQRHKHLVDFHKEVLKTNDDISRNQITRKLWYTFQCFGTILTSKTSSTFTDMNIINDSACTIILTYWIFSTWFITRTYRLKENFTIETIDWNKEQTWWTCWILSWISLSTIITLTIDRHNRIGCFYTLCIGTFDSCIRTFYKRLIDFFFFSLISTSLLTW